jgi:hypothetical protein
MIFSESRLSRSGSCHGSHDRADRARLQEGRGRKWMNSRAKFVVTGSLAESQ